VRGEEVEVAFLSHGRPTITRVVDFVQPPADRIAFGARLVFKLLQTPQAAAMRRNGFQIRIFALGENEMVPKALSEIDGCGIYVTSVVVIHGNDIDITVDRMDERWLAISNSRGSVRNGRYLLIFESIGAEESIFRLRMDDSARYFATGFRFVVEGEGKASIENVLAAYMERERKTVDLYAEIDKRGTEVRCYRYERLVDDDPARHVAEASLAMCSNPVPVGS